MSLAAAAVVGGGLQLIAKLRQNADDASAMSANADALNNQADFESAAYARKAVLLGNSQKEFNSKKLSMFAKNGISLAGSALDSVASDKVAQQNDIRSLLSEAAWSDSNTRNRASQYRNQASQLTNPFNTFLTVGTSALSTYANSQAIRGNGSALSREDADALAKVRAGLMTSRPSIDGSSSGFSDSFYYESPIYEKFGG